MTTAVTSYTPFSISGEKVTHRRITGNLWGYEVLPCIGSSPRLQGTLRLLLFPRLLLLFVLLWLLFQFLIGYPFPL